MQVNTVKVPESDLMATNGVVHFVRTLLYPEGGNYEIAVTVMFFFFVAIKSMFQELLIVILF